MAEIVAERGIVHGNRGRGVDYERVKHTNISAGLGGGRERDNNRSRELVSDPLPSQVHHHSCWCGEPLGTQQAIVKHEHVVAHQLLDRAINSSC